MINLKLNFSSPTVSIEEARRIFDTHFDVFHYKGELLRSGLICSENFGIAEFGVYSNFEETKEKIYKYIDRIDVNTLNNRDIHASFYIAISEYSGRQGFIFDKKFIEILKNSNCEIEIEWRI
jgi:hypothetical protein